MSTVKSDIEIAREAKMKPIMEIGKGLGIPEKDLIPYGHTKAKVHLDYVDSLKSKPNGKLILVTAINPTPAGEGKTTTTVGLGDGLNRIGKKAMVALREPSLGPCFGMKGGAAGGGYAQIVPMEDINLHFTGDFHAITSAHNLLSAMIDNHIYWGNELGIDSRRVAWRRVMDMNDRALREIVCSLGGVANGYPREAGFDITVASESHGDPLPRHLDRGPQRRIGHIIVGYTRDKTPRPRQDLKAPGAMTVLLKDALRRTSCRRSRTTRPSCMAAPSPTSRMAATRCGHADGAEARRLCRHRSRLRRRPRRREVLRHQVPQGRPVSGGHRHRRNRPCTEDAWRCRQGRT
jgi:formate--tetrahydrofolate ligase